MGNDTTANLIDAARAGDDRAILALIVTVQGDVRRYARRNCRSPSDAEDAVQETLWVLSRHIAGIRHAGALSSWLFQVVRRLCLKLARQAMPPATVAELERETALARRPADELKLDLTRAIQSLPPHYRDVLLLRDAEELTVDEIGVRLGLTRESVKARLHRARLLVREYLA